MGPKHLPENLTTEEFIAQAKPFAGHITNPLLEQALDRLATASGNERQDYTGHAIRPEGINFDNFRAFCKHHDGMPMDQIMRKLYVTMTLAFAFGHMAGFDKDGMIKSMIIAETAVIDSAEKAAKEELGRFEA